jgi:glycosyltransferase involved in cell wall biosynthesis
VTEAADVRRQKLLALRWHAVESLRSSSLARFLLGVARIGRGLARRAGGRRYDALDDLCSVGRVVRIAPLASVARSVARKDFDAACGPPGAPRALEENLLLREVRSGPAAREHLRWLAGQRGIRRPTLGGDLLVLKAPDRATGERGVVLLKYSNSMVRFLCVYDVARVLRDYQLVLEPSWVGYEDPVFHLFVSRDHHVVVQAHQSEDHAYLSGLRANLVPVATGSSYWVDEHTFRPVESEAKSYLAVMVANWIPLKRHEVLLRAFAGLPESEGRLALVGFPWEGFTRERIDDMIRRFGLSGRVDVFEWLTPDELNVVFNRAHANVLLSHKEGGNKAVFEGLFAGVPCIVAETHVGIRREDVNDATGVRATDDALRAALTRVKREARRFTPRAWALRHASSANSTRLVEEALREAAARDRLPWTRGILPKVNRPFARYQDPSMWEAMLPWYRDLAERLVDAARGDAAEPWDPAELDRLGEAARPVAP